jgi:NADH-quinone oxidoreductase subunit F
MLRRAVAAGPQGVIRELKDAKLLGRGGAAFPAAVKWEAVATNPVRPHYVVCNADESEPGTFKDRVLMEEDPYALVEALTIMGYTLQIGGPAFAQIGTDGSTGTRLFCLSGCVGRPGLYEYEFGVTLRQVIEAAGGVRGGRPLRDVLLGGAAGTFVAPDALDTPLTFEGVRAIGATLGSGVVLVLDDTVDLTDLLQRIARFFRDESCGQCVPCRVGTVRQEELLGRLAREAPLGSAERELALLDDIGAVARDASICGLGQTAVSAAASAVKLGLISAARANGNGREPV